MRKSIFYLMIIFSLFLSLYHFFANKNRLPIMSNAFQIDYQTTKANLYPPQLARIANQVERGKIFKYYFFFEKNFTDIFDLSLFSGSIHGIIYLAILLYATVLIFKDSVTELLVLSIFPILVFTLVGTNLKGVEICFLPIILYAVAKAILTSKC